MKKRHSIAIIGLLALTVVTVGCSRVIKNTNLTDNNSNTNINSSIKSGWHEVNFSLNGYVYSFQVPNVWKVDYMETNEKFLNAPQAISQPIPTTGVSSPRYDKDYNVLTNNNSSATFLSVEAGIYKNTDTFDSWYQSHRDVLADLHANNVASSDNTINISGISGKSIYTKSGTSTDNSGNLPAQRSVNLFIPMDGAVLNIYIGGETWLMDHFQETVDTIINSVKVE